MKAHKVKTVAMESTGIYWIPLFQHLERNGFEVLLVNARHVKNVPGRTKSDNRDCQWVQKLHTFGLLQGSFRPDDDVCKLRSFLRHRDNLIAMATKHTQHMHKALWQMNILLGNVVSDITGATGLRIIDAILAGERDRMNLAKLKDSRIKSSQKTIAKALEGDYRDEQVFILQQSLDMYRYTHQQIQHCDQQIQTIFHEWDKVPDSELDPYRLPQVAMFNPEIMNPPMMCKNTCMKLSVSISLRSLDYSLPPSKPSLLKSVLI